MYSDKKCVFCGKLMPNSHHLKKYCSGCLIKVRKQKNKQKTEIRRARNNEFNNLPEDEKTRIMMEARQDIMEDLENDKTFYKSKR